MAMASWRTADHYNEYGYGERFTTVRPIWKDAKSRMFFALTSADKTYTRAGVALKATVNYNRTTMPVAQNSVNAAITANVMAAALTLRWNKAGMAHADGATHIQPDMAGTVGLEHRTQHAEKFLQHCRSTHLPYSRA